MCYFYTLLYLRNYKNEKVVKIAKFRYKRIKKIKFYEQIRQYVETNKKFNFSK